MSVPTLLKTPKNLLHTLGVSSPYNLHYQLPPTTLAEQCVNRKEGVYNDTGALVRETGKIHRP